MIKIKMNKKNIFKIIYTVLLLINIIILFFFISFIRDNVYGAIIMDENYLLQNKKVDSVNIKKFEETLHKIEEKKQEADTSQIKNIF